VLRTNTSIIFLDSEFLVLDEIAPIVACSPTAARQLASRARRRVQGTAPVPDADLTHQREVVEAFLAAARGGDFDALLEVLDPDVVQRVDAGAVPEGVSRVVRGAQSVAKGALAASRRDTTVRLVLVNGTVGVVAFDPSGQPFAVIGFTVSGGKIVEFDVLADPARLLQLDLVVLND
jgi:ketosteroid isomerase-like protein